MLVYQRVLTSRSIPVTAKLHPQDALPQRREVWCASCLAGAGKHVSHKLDYIYIN